jgi:hypothetical protein
LVSSFAGNLPRALPDGCIECYSWKIHTTPQGHFLGAAEKVLNRCNVTIPSHSNITVPRSKPGFQSRDLREKRLFQTSAPISDRMPSVISVMVNLTVR